MTEELLSFAISQGIINLDDVRNSMKEKERQRILSNHPYSVFQDKDGRWKTTVKDESKKSKRRIIAKQTEEELYNEIVKYYTTKEDDLYIQQNLPTLNNMFGEWLNYKAKHSESSSYARRIKNDWNKYYANDEIINIPVSDLTFIKLDSWVHDLIKREKLTKKQYYNLTVIIRQMLDYMVEKGYVDNNPFNRIKVNNKLFTACQKPKSITQVFDTNTEKEIKRLALERYNNNNHAITPLAILFNFSLGLRVGELVALKWSDIDGNYLNIRHMEIAKYVVKDDGNVIKDGCEVVDYVKSDAGVRVLYLNKEAKNILNLVKKRSIEFGYYDEDFIFVSSQSSKRLTTGSINKYLYGLCDEINIQRKSSHKIRKTYISSLFDNGLNINKIREIAGHEDERTSLNNYCFDRKTDHDTEIILENLSNKVV